VGKSVRLQDLILGYKGSGVVLDFDGEDVLVGIEVLGD
jgi:hypothetical protein